MWVGCSYMYGAGGCTGHPPHRQSLPARRAMPCQAVPRRQVATALTVSRRPACWCFLSRPASARCCPSPCSSSAGRCTQAAPSGQHTDRPVHAVGSVTRRPQHCQNATSTPWFRAPGSKLPAPQVPHRRAHVPRHAFARRVHRPEAPSSVLLAPLPGQPGRRVVALAAHTDSQPARCHKQAPVSLSKDEQGQWPQTPRVWTGSCGLPPPLQLPTSAASSLSRPSLNERIRRLAWLCRPCRSPMPPATAYAPAAPL